MHVKQNYIVVASHYYMYGPELALEQFLYKKGVGQLLVLLHALPEVDPTWKSKNTTIVRKYYKGKKTHHKTLLITGR